MHISAPAAGRADRKRGQDRTAKGGKENIIYGIQYTILFFLIMNMSGLKVNLREGKKKEECE